MPEIPPPPPGFTMDTAVPPPPPGFKLDGEVPPPPPGFKMDEPSFDDVRGGSSTSAEDPGLMGQLGRSFRDAGRNIKKVAWDIPVEVLDRPLKPIRESLQQGGITGEMLPDIVKQNFGPAAGGFTAGVERDVAPGLVSGENVAMGAGMAANPVVGAAMLAKFGGEGAKSAIAASQAPPSETPEEKGRRYAQMAGGATMAVAPLIHAGSRFVREKVAETAPEPLDFGGIKGEDMAPDYHPADYAAFRDRVARENAVDAMQRFRDELPEPPPPKPRPVPAVEPPAGGPAFVDEQGFDPRIIEDFNNWADSQRPAFDDLPKQPPKPWAQGEPLEVPREIQDAAAENAEPPQTAVNSIGAEAPRSAEPAEVGAREKGDVRQGEGQGPVENMTLRALDDLGREGGVEPYEGSRFSRSNQGIRDAVAGNEEALVAAGKRAKPGEILSEEVQLALQRYTKDLIRKGGDEAEYKRLMDVLRESDSAAGRKLQSLNAAIENIDHTDPAAVVNLAVKATKGKLSIQAMRDLRDMSVKAKEVKTRSAEYINKRAEAALKRLEGMGEQVKTLTVKDVIGCR